MTNQPKPAPTAEEQPFIITEEDKDAGKQEAMHTKYFYSKVEKLASELSAALRSNREKDAQLADKPSALRLASLEAELEMAKAIWAEKDAKIAELERYTGYLRSSDNWRVFVNGLPEIVRAEKLAEAAEAKLRAVSEALEEKLEHWDESWAAGEFIEMIREEPHGRYIHTTDHDAFVAHIRAIVEGK